MPAHEYTHKDMLRRSGRPGRLTSEDAEEVDGDRTTPLAAMGLELVL